MVLKSYITIMYYKLFNSFKYLKKYNFVVKKPTSTSVEKTVVIKGLNEYA